MDRIECVVVGAGVVGLAIARRFALAGREVLVLESEGAIGTITSSRNSEVIHAGIYYPHHSLMARFCVLGRKMLYAYCAEHGVPHRNCGKLIVATNDAETDKLAAIRQHAAQNGVDDLRMISAAEARALEPAVHCTAALLSPSTGIIDSHGYMLALRGDAEANGASLAFNAPLGKTTTAGDGFVLDVGGSDPLTLGCKIPDQCSRAERACDGARNRGHASATGYRAPISPRATTSASPVGRRSRG